MDTVDVAVLFLGYVGACSRFYGGGEPVHEQLVRDIHAAAGGRPPDFGPSIRELGPAAQVDSFIPLFEALHWATSLEFRIAAGWPEVGPFKDWYRAMPGGLTVRAVRFARNRVHHQWAEAFTISDSDRDLPRRLVPWTWLPELPAGKPDAEGEAVYRADLAGELVIGALGRLSAIFGRGPRHLHDAGLAQSEPLTELLPAIDSIDAKAFSRNALTNGS